MKSGQASRYNYKIYKKEKKIDMLFNTLEIQSAKYRPWESLQDKQPMFFNQ